MSGRSAAGKLKRSRYVSCAKADDGSRLLFNARTGSLAELSPPLARAYREYPRNARRLRTRELASQGFLVAGDLREADCIKLRMKCGAFFSGATLVIAPTLACNFTCTYCFQRCAPLSMSEKTQRQVLAFVPKHIAGRKKLHVCWFGGEPLLPKSLAIIDKLSTRIMRLCDSAGCSYSASTSTNGYLLTTKCARLLRDRAVSGVQITLDGPAHIHDQRRRLRNGRGSFDVILGNVQAAADIVAIAIRVNIDRDNVDHVEELLAILAKKGLHKRISSLDLAQTEPIIPGRIRCFDNRTFIREQLRLYREAYRMGFPVDEYALQMLPIDIHCTALSSSHFSIAPDGYMYKCRNVFGNVAESIGHVGRPEELTDRARRWASFNPFHDKECRACKLLPICLGGCAYAAIYCKPDSKKCLKYFFEERIKLLAGCQRPGNAASTGCVNCY